MNFDAFISYASKDKPTADAVCAALEDAQIRCWIAPRDILPGSDWSASIIDALDQCRVMILIFSGNANDSPQISQRSRSRGAPRRACDSGSHRGHPAGKVSRLFHEWSALARCALAAARGASQTARRNRAHHAAARSGGGGVRRNGGRGRKDHRAGRRVHGSFVGWPAARGGVARTSPGYPRDMAKVARRAPLRCPDVSVPPWSAP